ncbi:MAG: cysteine--tRNA ligase, partial [Candidatus Yanofskybacteria bacterium]|nr:cysteine--tRNA ligase [Candidatus Yanofskybacteria bacterium]
MEIYNTLSGRKEVLKPRGSVRGKKFELFVCGITPYDLPHIGNARTYIFYDMMVRYLRSQGYEVSYLQNITDVDDKIILRAKELSMTPRQLARKFEREYMQSMKALGVKSVDSYQRATDNIPEIISQVERLLKKGYAYGAEDGVYYDISKFKDYGKLSGRTVQQAEDATSRIDESVKKRNRGDFALWKFSKKGEPAWPSLWGKGRPGWHIEDTAITEKHFGPQYDMHGGARDLIFPHHEAEIAQMEAVSGKKPLARYWVHTGFLTVGGEKMSKSLGNFVTVRDFLANHSPRL